MNARFLEEDPLNADQADVEIDYTQILPSSIPDVKNLKFLRKLNLGSITGELIHFEDSLGKSVMCVLPAVGCCVEGTISDKCDEVKKHTINKRFIRRI